MSPTMKIVKRIKNDKQFKVQQIKAQEIKIVQI